ncbi:MULTISPECIES: acyl-CoA reductase [Cellulophaga]|uniref:long-chain-fatty-acyl-CoA reductase n=1 Tax=Cellulophaga lytica (strain ATCC 23178 / DSM 7489 / JCM 8516 / NBRC 14961 / NCIMB 1423 / VKM B-1433 / Cy l20) TaxID=867900 RepID=F0RCS4_CELLC|nr:MULTISPECIES: acyl-CoA reductase [Cellulophaga]ADY30806.1 acyl-CoA reductase [Cellulophaga lytica DSM 7489]AIM61786.1 acyl-CoA reductase [Cellulophaga lytica]TVZ09858.1 acyl-CoA reductase LuxC [Cellulophaga sp. RHA_52]WQG78273.1 acyl-CoA reductase [Cellulophaga lytica]
MAKLEDRIVAFSELGTLFADYYEFANSEKQEENTNEWVLKLQDAVHTASLHNGWFTEENILFCLKNWSNLLTQKNLNNWFKSYDLNLLKIKKVAIIMAGNIPLVGFHDFLATILTGNTALIKLSSNDKILLPFVSSFLIKQLPELANSITYVDGRLEGFDAVIATGSDNTARYFEHYFGKKPNIIRKNRNSVAVLTGNETNEQLENLAEDIFTYYGLGCRSVSKLFVPKGYNFDAFFKAMYPKQDIIHHVKYANNYDYNKAVYLMSEFNILENGFLMIKEDESYASPISSVFYEYYESLDTLKQKLTNDNNKIQCVVASGLLENEVAFGQTQQPSLTDYADNIDTVEFLLKTS